MKVKAVIDRFEGNKAVLLVGEEENQAVWLRKFLPSDVEEGDILQVNWQIDHEATAAAKAEAESLLQQVLGKN
jgi:hypothetical protein